ncbi:class V lanthionine synthetase subunit LxmK [Embleya sp. NBC_00888]|uniref:class V lanthionine synthetase subunit LxmK n=1 Tax=Embleya sp. NBC_00888 TaxID=2975960 RepID=UPI003868B787|nr:class V lanthionine synthetase subunit LxmK [Embleya sp. NBC_00888]
MNATEQVAPATRSSGRVIQAAPLESPDEFVRAVAALSGAEPLVADMQGYVGRNDNWRVPTADAGDLFVKRLRGDRRQVQARMSRLLAYQDVIAAHPQREAATPRFHGADREQSLLVFDHLPESRAASDLLAGDEFTVELAHRLGRVLAEIHRLPKIPLDIEEIVEGKALTAFYALSSDDYANCSGGEVEAWAMLQHDRELVRALERLRDMTADAPTAATHCDIRLDQFLLAGDDVHVIDWEEFRYSDPARDVGGFVGEFLHHCAARMFAELDVEAGLSPGAAHDAILAHGERQLEKIQGHIARFWAGYRELAEIDDGLAVRATGYAGWHFFDRLLAGAVHGAKLTAAERGMAGIGRNALTHPERFAPSIGLDRGVI